MSAVSLLTAAALLTFTSVSAGTMQAAQSLVCAIDMGSNTFRRITGRFADGRYEQQPIEKKTLGVGDDVMRNGRISDTKLAEIGQTLSAFKDACGKDGAPQVVAIGTAAFRDAPNGRAAVELAKGLGIRMEIATEAREAELAYLVGTLGRSGYAVIDNGSRSIELVGRDDRALSHVVFNLGYRVAYDTFFATANDPAAASEAFRSRLTQEAATASFMKAKRALIGVEFGEMAEILFAPGAIEGRVLTLEALQQKLREITSSGAEAFATLKMKKDIDRALPRLVVAVTLVETFDYSALELTDRELGAGLIIEAGLKAR
jgi:exopolyphosphatase/pppGpp-phosphohydrolase